MRYNLAVNVIFIDMRTTDYSANKTISFVLITLAQTACFVGGLN
jgi:hypothetical protein